MDGEILEKCIDVETFCLAQKEKEELIDILYRYKEAFNLSDEMGTCCNIEVGIDEVYDTFFIRPYYVME